MGGYLTRFTDTTLKNRLNSSGAVLIRGPKGCGKTETAVQMAKSTARLDVDDDIRFRMELDPRSALTGPVPRLIDEWQEYPQIWNYIRREVDDRKKKGQFILTGSANPEEQARLHSGAGRFSIIKMRPMSLFERGWSTGEVSLAKLVKETAPKSEQVEFDLGTLAERITLGGWPSLIGAGGREALRFMQDYIALMAEVDISRVGGKKRDPQRVLRLLQSLARNIATEASVTSLAKDTGGSDVKITDETITDYLETLERLMAVEQLPAWRAHIRSADTLRKAPKRHFVDPSLAVGALGLSTDKLLGDLNYFGFLFESLVIRDLRIYANVHDGAVYHYRDSRNLEVDAIVEYPDGAWAAFEVKMGFSAQDEAAANLLTFAAKIDQEKMGPPAALTVITANGFACRRKDGVNVVPLSALTA
ncbi:ATPase AAA [Spirochaetia bacterium]|nr:ATPase AAA [Spirochaetia bacterium]GHU57919.1 ATPase AAA [Spirochaetia bacterium]